MLPRPAPTATTAAMRGLAGAMAGLLLGLGIALGSGTAMAGSYGGEHGASAPVSGGPAAIRSNGGPRAIAGGAARGSTASPGTTRKHGLRDRRHGSKPGKHPTYRKRHPGDRFRYRYPYGFFWGGDRRDDVIVIVQPPAPAAEPPAAAPEPPASTDPAGPLRRLPARGRAIADPDFALGTLLAPTLPLVTLDWRRHELPEPLAGEIWVRVDRTVLRIDAGTRAIRGFAPEPEATAKDSAASPKAGEG